MGLNGNVVENTADGDSAIYIMDGRVPDAVSRMSSSCSLVPSGGDVSSGDRRNEKSSKKRPSNKNMGMPGICKLIVIPPLMRQFLAELLGTFLLVLFGDGAIAQVKIGNVNSSSNFFSNFQTIAFAYGFALMIGILVSGGVSGGHLNPAVTLAMAAIRKLSLTQVPVYWMAQYLGAMVASIFVYGLYADGIAHLENNGMMLPQFNKTLNSAGIFASYPASFEPGVATLTFDQMLGTALLVIIILAVTDEKNIGVDGGMVPLLIGLGLCAIHMSFGLNAGSAINPARDFSPRLFTLIAGWGSATFSSHNYFFWIPLLIPHVGGIIGAFIYKFAISYHIPPGDNN